jgi:hypothetical protein
MRKEEITVPLVKVKTKISGDFSDFDSTKPVLAVGDPLEAPG